MSLVLVETKERIARIELNRAEELNALCARAYALEDFVLLGQRFPDWARFIENKVRGDREPPPVAAGGEVATEETSWPR